MLKTVKFWEKGKEGLLHKQDNNCGGIQENKGMY